MSIIKYNIFIIVIFFSCTSQKNDNNNLNQDSAALNFESNIDYIPDRDSLNQLSRYFKKKGSIIPNSVCSKYLDVVGFDDLYSECSAEKLMVHENLNLFIIRLKCTAGGVCEETQLLIFDGESFKSALRIGWNLADLSFEKHIEYKFVDNNLIELRNSIQEFEINGNLKNDTSYIEYHKIGKDGLIRKVVD